MWGQFHSGLNQGLAFASSMFHDQQNPKHLCRKTLAGLQLQCCMHVCHRSLCIDYNFRASSWACCRLQLIISSPYKLQWSSLPHHCHGNSNCSGLVSCCTNRSCDNCMIQSNWLVMSIPTLTGNNSMSVDRGGGREEDQWEVDVRQVEVKHLERGREIGNSMKFLHSSVSIMSMWPRRVGKSTSTHGACSSGTRL